MRLIPLLLALALSWEAPAANCDGSMLTDLDHYELPIFRVVILGWNVCVMEDGTKYPCPIYDWSLQRRSTAGAETSLSLADPGPGEVVGWEDIEAIDAAGNSSAECGT